MTYTGSAGGRGLSDDERAMLDALERGGRLTQMELGKLRAYSLTGNEGERARARRLLDGSAGSAGSGKGRKSGDAMVKELADQIYKKALKRMSEGGE